MLMPLMMMMMKITELLHAAVKCNVRIKGEPVQAILDSGAAVCVITKLLAQKLNLKITKPSKTIVVTCYC